MRQSDRKSVLVVGDDAMNLMVVKNLLSEYFDVRVTRSVETALFILNGSGVDIVLLDIDAPGMSGLEFIDILSELPGIEDMPIISISSKAGSYALSAAICATANIIKPLYSRQLIEKVFSVLDMRVPS